MKVKFKLLSLCIVLAVMLVACYNGTNKSGNYDETKNTKSDGVNQMSIYCDPGMRSLSLKFS